MKQSKYSPARCGAQVMVFLTLLLFCASPSMAADTSLCAASEKVWFNAQVKESSQLVSLCGAAPVRGTVAWLQFRMGVPDDLSVIWPLGREGSARAFTLRRYTRFRTTYLKFEFRIGDQEFAILEDDVSEDTPQYSLRLRVRKAPGETELANHRLKSISKPLAMMRLGNHIRSLPYDE